MLSRPYYDPTRHVETIVDADGFVANAWRSLQHDPDAVAKYCDWPINHADLSARKKVMLRECLYFSPHCLSGKTLFDGINDDPIMTTSQEENHDI